MVGMLMRPPYGDQAAQPVIVVQHHQHVGRPLGRTVGQERVPVRGRLPHVEVDLPLELLRHVASLLLRPDDQPFQDAAREDEPSSPSQGEDGSPPPGAWLPRHRRLGGGGRVLRSWNDGAALAAIRDFVARVTAEGSPEFLPVAERVAVFDNDGTLWCEKPMPIELGFILQRLAAMAEQDPALRERQPWKAAYDRDYHWLGEVITKHYAGDDSELKVVLGGVLQAFAGMDVEAYQVAAHGFLHQGRHPTLDRHFFRCGYKPMVELLEYLTANGFSCYIASGGDRDFMRPVTERIYGIPAERVIGTSNALRYEPDEHGGTIVYLAEPDYFNDGPTKPLRIWSRIGRRPVLAAGNSNGDIEMLQFAGGPSRPGLSLLVLHDDPEREFDYVAGAERALEAARANGWTVVSVKRDWATVFDDATASTHEEGS